MHKQSPTYVAFIDYTTAFPSVFRHKLLCLLFENGIVGKTWHHLRERFRTVSIRVLHPGLSATERVEVPEGSKLSPILFGIFAADLIRELERRFPNATISHGPQSIWVGGILYVDDLALISTDPSELQDMINVCQEWGERSRMQINADKSKVMAFHEATAERNARTKPRKTRQGGTPVVVRPTPFHLLFRFPNRYPDDRHPGPRASSPSASKK